MKLRALKRGLNNGSYRWIKMEAPVEAESQFQKERMTTAVMIAKAYLNDGVDSSEIAKMLGVTRQRSQQIIQVGVAYMLEHGWIKARKRPARTASA